MVTLEMKSFHFAGWMSGNCSCNTLSKDAWQSVRFDVSVRDQHKGKRRILESFLNFRPRFPCIPCFPVSYVDFAGGHRCWCAGILEVGFVSISSPFSKNVTAWF